MVPRTNLQMTVAVSQDSRRLTSLLSYFNKENKVGTRIPEAREPQSSLTNRPIPLMRCLTMQKKRAICVSTDWFGFHTHWHDERTVFCCGAEHCLLCERGSELRWVGLLAFRRLTTESYFLLPLTAASLEPIRYIATYGCLYGSTFDFWRQTDNPRSMLNAEWISTDRELVARKYEKSDLESHAIRIYQMKA